MWDFYNQGKKYKAQITEMFHLTNFFGKPLKKTICRTRLYLLYMTVVSFVSSLFGGSKGVNVKTILSFVPTFSF